MPRGTKKQGGCGTCKDKEVTSLDPINEVPTITNQTKINDVSVDEIHQALIMMESVKTDEQYEYVNNIYKKLFNEELPRNCKSCGGNFYRKLKYIYDKLRGIKTKN